MAHHHVHFCTDSNYESGRTLGNIAISWCVTVTSLRLRLRPREILKRGKVRVGMHIGRSTHIRTGSQATADGGATHLSEQKATPIIRQLDTADTGSLAFWHSGNAG